MKLKLICVNSLVRNRPVNGIENGQRVKKIRICGLAEYEDENAEKTQNKVKKLISLMEIRLSKRYSLLKMIMVQIRLLKARHLISWIRKLRDVLLISSICLYY